MAMSEVAGVPQALVEPHSPVATCQGASMAPPSCPQPGRRCAQQGKSEDAEEDQSLLQPGDAKAVGTTRTRTQVPERICCYTHRSGGSRTVP